jgi:Transcriptional regulator PadR-like family
LSTLHRPFVGRWPALRPDDEGFPPTALRQEFESRTGEVWPLNVGQVYTTLQRRERDGLVESDDPEGDGPQKGFRITAWRRSCAGWTRPIPG